MVENPKRAKSSWATIVPGYFSFHSYQNNQRVAKAEQAAQLIYENIQKEGMRYLMMPLLRPCILVQ